MPQKPSGKIPLRGFPWKGEFVSKQDIDHYFSDPDGIQCLLCGRLLGTLNNHLQIVHETSHEEYRARYGLPWRRGLVSPNLSKHLSERLAKRIRDGSFKPKPDNLAAVAKIRAGGRRKDQPFITASKAKLGKEQSKQNLSYNHEDFSKVLAVMLDRRVTLNEACMDKKLPSKGTVLRYAESNPAFRKRLLDTYHALPYAVQARADMFSPQFFEDMKRLRAKGLSAKEIGRRLHVNWKTVQKRLREIWQR
jgi:hypothetical protein